MTNKEAKVFMLQFNTDKRLNPSEHEAVRVAIKVLSAEPCEDCISRKAVLELKTPVDTMIGWRGYMIDALDVEQLPSIQPKANTEVLDKIRAEIIENSIKDYEYHGCGTEELIIETSEVLQIIDKYKAEREEQE